MQRTRRRRSDEHRPQRRQPPAELKPISAVAEPQYTPFEDERFRALVQNLADIITIHREDGTTIFESSSAARILGYGPDGLINRNPFDAIHPRDRPAVQAGFRALVAGLTITDPIEFRFRHAEGRWIHLEGVGTNLLHETGIGGIVLTSRDITQRKLAEQRIRHVAHLLALQVPAGDDGDGVADARRENAIVGTAVLGFSRRSGGRLGSRRGARRLLQGGAFDVDAGQLGLSQRGGRRKQKEREPRHGVGWVER